MWNILNKYRAQCVCVLLLLMSLLSWASGYRVARLMMQEEQAKERLHYEQQAKQRLQTALAEQQKWQQLAQQQSLQLAQVRQQLDAQAALLNKEIPNAIQNDNETHGAAYSGIGKHSLHIYKRAFGYAD